MLLGITRAEIDGGGSRVVDHAFCVKERVIKTHAWFMHALRIFNHAFLAIKLCRVRSGAE